MRFIVQMSAIAGLLHLTDLPIERTQLEKMLAAMAYRAVDGSRSWNVGSIGLAHCHFWTTPEDVGERQPTCEPQQRYWIVADARIDNRAELVPLFRAKGLLPQKIPTDAELIIAAYAEWGHESPKHLLGDFAFAIWDMAQRQLFLARDVIGIRQLYYAIVDGVFYFGTAISAILAGSEHRFDLNRPWIEEFLRRRYELSVTQTIYAGVKRLPAAHQMVIDQGQITTTQYYRFGEAKRLPYQSDAEWIEAFREVLATAIECRMRSTTPVGFWVSGGLDSSSLACMTYELRKRQPALPEFHLYTTIFEETPTADERIYFEAVAERCAGVPVTRIVADELWALREFGTDNNFPLDEPDLFLLRADSLALLRSSVNDGNRVTIWGNGGDAVLGENLYYDSRALRGVAWRNWYSEAKYFRRQQQISWKTLLLHGYIYPQIPSQWQNRLRRLKTQFRPIPPTPVWLTNKEWDTRSTLEKFSAVSINQLSPAAQVVAGDTFGDCEPLRFSEIDRVMSFGGVEHRTPYLDKRLIEFMLQVPQHLIGENGVHRVLIRKSMEGVLPEMVRNRHGKVLFDELIHRGIHQEKRRILAFLDCCKCEMFGFVDSSLLRHTLHSYLDSPKIKYRLSRRIAPVLCLEAWLQAHAFQT